MAAKDAIAIIRKTEQLSKAVVKAVGEPKPEKAINQLNELWQKKIIPKPKYNCKEFNKGPNGNDVWQCTCEIPGFFIKQTAISTTKAEGKKAAAFGALCGLKGFDMEAYLTLCGKAVTEEDVLCNGVPKNELET